MEFNTDKCEVLRTHRKKNPVIFPYTDTHLITPPSEPQKTQNISGSLSVVTAYRTYVRPMSYIHYCSTIWYPWQKQLTHRIEMGQRSAARYVQYDYHYTSSVTSMLRELKWSTVEQCRNQASFIMLHKIHNKQVNVDHSHLTTTCT